MLGDADELGDTLLLGLTDGETLDEGDTDGDGETLGDWLLLGLTLGDGDNEGETEVLGLPDADGDTDGESLELGLTDGEGETEGLGETLGLPSLISPACRLSRWNPVEAEAVPAFLTPALPAAVMEVSVIGPISNTSLT